MGAVLLSVIDRSSRDGSEPASCNTSLSAVADEFGWISGIAAAILKGVLIINNE